MSRALCTAALALPLITLRISAHHAFAAEYDVDKHVTVSGTVAGFTWTNPHAWLYVNVTDQKGGMTRWGFEMDSPNGLLHRGRRKTERKEGDPVSVKGYPPRTATTWPMPAP